MSRGVAVDPCLAENQKIIGSPAKFYDEQNPYYLPDAMADMTIEWLHAVRAQDAKKPFFAHFSTGCSHTPHHVFQSWAEKYKDKFDQGLHGTPRAHRRSDRRSRDSGRLDPRLLASARCCRSRGGAATVADALLAAGRDELRERDEVAGGLLDPHEDAERSSGAAVRRRSAWSISLGLASGVTTKSSAARLRSWSRASSGAGKIFAAGRIELVVGDRVRGGSRGG